MPSKHKVAGSNPARGALLTTIIRSIMNSNMRSVFISALIVLAVAIVATNVGFFTYKASLDDHDTSKACVGSGGEWSVWDNSDTDYPRYECIR